MIDSKVNNIIYFYFSIFVFYILLSLLYYSQYYEFFEIVRIFLLIPIKMNFKDCVI